MTHIFFILSLFISLMITSINGQDRKINATLNPGCQECTNSSILVYITANGENDTIHQVWDFTRALPTVIYIIAGLNSSLAIMWDGSRPRDFILSEKAKYSFAAAIDKIYEYNDIGDKGPIDAHTHQRSFTLKNKNMKWTLKDSVLTESETMLKMHGEYNGNDEGTHRTGIIDMKLDLLPFQDYAVDLPHLIHTANSTLIDVSIINMTTWKYYNSSRFALHFVLVSTDSTSEKMVYTMRKSLDDEHTPGVFEIIELKTPETSKHGDGGFLQFRPVAYTEPVRSVSSSTNAYTSTFNKTGLPHRSTLGVFYKDYDMDNLLVEDVLISFGLTGDGFYKHNNFTAWSFTIGYGVPPVEGFSLFVIVLISLGAGAPLLLALSAAAYAACSRARTARPARLLDH